MFIRNSEWIAKPRIGILDVFGKKKAVPINGLCKDFAHGNITCAVLRGLTADLDVQIVTIPVKAARNDPKNVYFDSKSFLKQLKKINKAGKDFEYLNISNFIGLRFDLLGLSKEGIELLDESVRAKVLKTLRFGGGGSFKERYIA